MPKYQYRVAGPLAWISSSGNAWFALINKANSGKKITIRSFEITPRSMASTTGITLPCMARLSTVTGVANGIPITPVKNDSNSASWPSNIVVSLNSTFTEAAVIRQLIIQKTYVPTLQTSFIAQSAIGSLRGLYQGRRRVASSAVEPLVVRTGEAIALYLSVVQIPNPLKISMTLSIAGANYNIIKFVNAVDTASSIISINNTSASTVVKIIEFSIQEVGTYDSPYFQFVPVGALTVEALADTSESGAPQVLKMDSAYPDITSFASVHTDAGLIPFGVPQVYLTEASTGTPKGFNYLQTKDFVGPVTRAYFPEFLVRRDSNIEALCGYASMKMCDIGFKRAGYVIREGEGLALVSAAETAILSSAVGVSGWNCFDVGVTFDIEPKLYPTLTLTGIKNPSEVRVYTAGTTTELSGTENVTSGTFTYTYDPDLVSSVDIVIHSLAYQYFRIETLALGLSDTSVPISQQLDRNYSN